MFCFFFFKQKTAYEMRISDWSSDVCSSDLRIVLHRRVRGDPRQGPDGFECRDPVGRGRQLRPISRPVLRHGVSMGTATIDRKSVVSGTSVSVRVDLGGRRIIKNKRKK